MSIEEDTLIQNFLKNTLSKKERNEVLLRIETDEDFRKKVDFEKQLLLNLNTNEWSVSTNYELPEVKAYEELFKSKFTEELQNTLSEVNADYQKTQKKKPKYWLLLTGVAAILILIGVSIFSPFTATSSQKLYASYVDYSELPSLIDRGKTDQITLIKAQKLFEAEKYDQALNILTNNLDSLQKNRAAIYLYTGISQMELNQFNNAKKSFDDLINSGLMDAPKGKWYKALLFLKQNKIQKAKELLSEIAQSPNNYKSKAASELLEQL